MMPTGRSRGTTSATRMKIVASIQYTMTAYLADDLDERGTWPRDKRFDTSSADALEELTHGYQPE